MLRKPKLPFRSDAGGVTLCSISHDTCVVNIAQHMADGVSVDLWHAGSAATRQYNSKSRHWLEAKHPAWITQSIGSPAAGLIYLCGYCVPGCGMEVRGRGRGTVTGTWHAPHGNKNPSVPFALVAASGWLIQGVGGFREIYLAK